MDDNTIFNNQNTPPATPPSQDSSGPKITTQDLYGPSTTQPQAPAQDQGVAPQTPGAAESVQPPQPPPSPYDQTTQPQGQVIDQTSGQPQAIPQQQYTDQQVPQQGQYPSQGVDITQAPQDAYAQQAGYPPPSNPLSALLGNKKLVVIGAVIGAFFVLLIVIGIVSRLFGQKNGSAYSNATLTYWGLWEEQKTIQVIIDDFEKKYPGIKVKFEKQDPQKYKERLLTRVKNNTEAPDVFTIHNTWVPTLTNSADNILLPLPKDTVSPDEFKNTYFPIVQKDLTKNGAIYGLPQGVDTLALFINKEIFDAAQIKPPKTWEDFNAAAKALTVKDENEKIKTAGVALGTYDNITHAPDILSLLLVTNGVDLETIDKQADFVKEAIVYYTSFAKVPNSVWNNTLSASRDMFAAGNLAMYFGYSWDIFAIKAANKNLQFEVLPVPYLPRQGGTPHTVTIASYWANGVSTKTKHQKEALLFLQYMAQKDVIQKIYTESSKLRFFGMPYARKDLASTLTDNALIFPFVKQAEYATSSYFASDTTDTLYNGPLNDYLGNVIRQNASNVSLDTAMETFMSGVAQVRSQALR